MALSPHVAYYAQQRINKKVSRESAAFSMLCSSIYASMSCACMSLMCQTCACALCLLVLGRLVPAHP
jgi:hypothetical protein